MIPVGKSFIAVLAVCAALVLPGCYREAVFDVDSTESLELYEESGDGGSERETVVSSTQNESSTSGSSDSESSRDAESETDESGDPEQSSGSDTTTEGWEDQLEGETNENGVVDGQPLENVDEVVSTAAVDEESIRSDLPYLIKVNRQANCVTVYTKDENGDYTVPVKAMVCSCAREGYSTPLGTFQISDHYVWRELYGNVYGYYSVRIVGSILFHSVPYLSPDASTLENEEYDKLGENASQGCVRLQVKDSKWIYDNCAAGTYVIIYDSSDPGPLGKPSAMKISGVTSKFWGWDPTDVTAGNPYLSCTDTFSVSSTSVSLKLGDEVDLTEYVTAVDLYGNSVQVDISGTVNTGKAGKYKVVYSVTDIFGYSDSVTVRFTVEEEETETEEETDESTERTTKKETTSGKREETTAPPETTEKQTATVSFETTEEQTTTVSPETTEEQTTTAPPETTEEQTSGTQPEATEEQSSETQSETAAQSEESANDTEQESLN